MPFDTYDIVPDVSASPIGLAALRLFLYRGTYRTARLMVLGDSTLSWFSSSSCVLAPALTATLGQLYGNVPALTYLDAFDQNHAQNPFCLRSIWDNTGADPRADADASHYGTAPIASLPTGVRPTGYLNTSNGIFFELMGGNVNATDPTLTYQRLFGNPDAAWNLRDQIGAKIHAVTGTSSGEMTWKQTNTQTVGGWAIGITDFGAPVASGTTAMGLESATAGVIKTLDLGALVTPNTTNVAIQLNGTSATKRTNILGATFYNASNPNGVHVIPFAESGASAATLANNHPNCDANLPAFGTPDAVWIQYGINDAASSTAATFLSNMQSVITRVRAAFPGVLLILVCPRYRDGLTSGQLAEYDQYAGALASFVAGDGGPSVAVNGRGITYRTGWNTNTYTNYMADTLHDNAVGARIESAQLVQALAKSVGNVTGAFPDYTATLASIGNTVTALAGRAGVR